MSRPVALQVLSHRSCVCQAAHQDQRRGIKSPPGCDPGDGRGQPRVLALRARDQEATVASLKVQQQRLIRLYTEEGEDTSPDAFRAERARMKQEIAAAEASLAETEGRLEINESDLCRAL